MKHTAKAVKINTYTSASSTDMPKTAFQIVLNGVFILFIPHYPSTDQEAVVHSLL